MEVQTEMTCKDVSGLQQELNTMYEENRILKVQLQSLQPFTEASMQDDERVQFYTGLPNFQTLLTIFEFVAPEQSSSSKLSPFQEFMMALIKLRMNLPMKDLAYCFDVSIVTISRIWLKWFVHMDIKLRSLILWPEREQLQKTMPSSFQSAFGNKVAVIIDCFEVFIERPSNLLARACTWSSYKHHNTIKILIGITPQSVISYLSDAWGG